MAKNTTPNRRMRLDQSEWAELYYAVSDYGDGPPDDLIGPDGRDGWEEGLPTGALERFISALRTKQRAIRNKKYGEEISELFTDSEWLRILRSAERKLSFWMKLRAGSGQPAA